MEGPSDTIRFLRERFSDYYRGNQPILPPRFGSREWAFFLWEGKGMLRHTAFQSKAKLLHFMTLKGPRHVYHSAAYYQRPGAGTMGQKGWLGADLIFDIDADHIPGHEKMNYKEQLERVKVEIVKLVNEFLIKEFAFEEEFLDIVFSGGRGYHVHVRDPRVWRLNSYERKEIVDYIMATDLNTDMLYKDTVFHVAGSGQFIKEYKKRELPSPREPGWRGRFAGGIENYLKELKRLSREEAIKDLMKEDGIGKKMAEEIFNALFQGSPGKTGFDKVINEHTIEIFPSELPKTKLTNLVINRNKVWAGETDAPVTKDKNRLIRLPGSLHGKSSLRVIPLAFDDIKDFEPLRDAVVFDDGPVRVKVKEDTSFEVGGQSFKVTEGETELPAFAAIFLMARGGADIVG